MVPLPHVLFSNNPPLQYKILSFEEPRGSRLSRNVRGEHGGHPHSTSDSRSDERRWSLSNKLVLPGDKAGDYAIGATSRAIWSKNGDDLDESPETSEAEVGSRQIAFSRHDPRSCFRRLFKFNTPYRYPWVLFSVVKCPLTNKLYVFMVLKVS